MLLFCFVFVFWWEIRRKAERQGGGREMEKARMVWETVTLESELGCTVVHQVTIYG